MVWTCANCGKRLRDFSECTQHIIETSGHIFFKGEDGTPINLDFTLKDGLHDCFDEGVQHLLSNFGHPNRDFIFLTCSSSVPRKCPIDGKDECKLDREDVFKLGYHEFSNGSLGHRFSWKLNLPLVEILFSKGYPSIVQKLKADIETEEKRFKALEAEGKALKMGPITFGVPEGDSWNLVTQCKKCHRWQKLAMLVPKRPQDMPENLFSIGFTCQSCGEKYQIAPKDCLDRSEWMGYLLKRLIESNPKIADQFSEIVNPNAKSNNPVYV